MLARSSAEDIYLSITPRILASAFSEAGYELIGPDEAERRFALAVANAYRYRVLAHSGRLRALRRCGDDGSPDCVGFLAASVLAAYRMQSDEDAAGHAYYVRLAELLQCDISGTRPLGFNPTVFESLWAFLGNWLQQAHGLRLATPHGDVGFRRFVALPLAHVPLRRLDIDKLPAFFGWADYAPGSRPRRDKLLADVLGWQHATNALTPTGAHALNDERCNAVLAQVASELESWDGTIVESVSRRSALIELLFDVILRRPQLSYLPRRPAGFPETFDAGQHVFEAFDEGWYDPIPMRLDDGDLLANGFEWRSIVNNIQFALRRQTARVVALSPSSSYSGFLSTRRLIRGVKCAVLCHEDVVADATEYLSDVTQHRCQPATDPALPRGWRIFTPIRVTQTIEAPRGLESLEVDPNVELLISGGLRVGRRWAWILGAPPRILVTGLEEGLSATINGVPILQGSDGELLINGRFSEPGTYVIEAGRARRRIELLAPEVDSPLTNRPDPTDTVRPAGSIALPRGEWTLIGSSPGQVCRPADMFRGGGLAVCPFAPVWAVQVGSGPGAVVAAAGELVQPTAKRACHVRGSSRAQMKHWAFVIYNAHVRHPGFSRLLSRVDDADACTVWTQYVQVAKQIKRALRRR
ncbi:MAG: hypothetical protein ACE5FA_04910 [Dehalococcoidia bacterium]